MTATRSHSGVVCFVLLVLACAIALVAIPTIGEIQLGTHAIQRHGQVAVNARAWIQEHAGAQNRFDCPDGRTRIVVQMDNRHYAIMVLQGGLEISTFKTSKRSYAVKVTRGCSGGSTFAPSF